MNMDFLGVKFEEYANRKQIDYFKVKLPFGELFLCDNFFVSEILSETHIDEDKMLKIVETILKYYGKNVKICYISNRINSYSSNPVLWAKVLKKYDVFSSGAIVYLNLSGYMNFEVEKNICKKEMKSFKTLDDALSWINDKLFANQN